MDEGHCGLPRQELIPLAEKLLEVPQQLIGAILHVLAAKGTEILLCAPTGRAAKRIGDRLRPKS